MELKNYAGWFFHMKNKCIGFFGPTGSGKTTELNRIAKEAAENFSISYCFQDNRLLENLSVLKNVILPLENKYSKAEAEKIARQWINKLDLQNKTDSLASKLSGGEKQRVALARAFSYDGDLFLLDEPFSAQDSFHKDIIFNFIKDLKKQNKKIYLVSHDEKILEDLCDEVRQFSTNNHEPKTE